MSIRVVATAVLGAAMACLAATAPSSGAPPAGTAERPLSPVERPRSESAVAVNPRDPRQVVVGVMEYASSVTTAEFFLKTGHAPRAHVYVSRDGGATYRDAGLLPGPDGARGTSLDQTFAWDSRGPLYAGYLAYHDPSVPEPASSRGGIWVARSDNGGQSWRGTPVGPDTVEDDGCHGGDKPAVTVDRRGHVYAVWQVMVAAGCDGVYEATGRFDFTRSGDGGRTWSRPVRLELPIGGWAPVLAGLADGTIALAFMGLHQTEVTHPECGGESAPVYVARLSPSGEAEAYPVFAHVCTVFGMNRNASAYRAQELPTMTVEPVSQTLVVAAPDHRPADEGLAVATSRNGGRTWAPDPLPAEPGYAFTHAQLAAGPRMIALSYLANAPGGSYLPTLRASWNLGKTWSPAVALASEPSIGAQRFTPGVLYNPVDPFGLGHYQGLAIGRDGLAHAAWPDLRPRDHVHDVDTWVRAVRLPR